MSQFRSFSRLSQESTNSSSIIRGEENPNGGRNSRKVSMDDGKTSSPEEKSPASGVRTDRRMSKKLTKIRDLTQNKISNFGLSELDFMLEESKTMIKKVKTIISKIYFKIWKKQDY